MSSDNITTSVTYGRMIKNLAMVRKLAEIKKINPTQLEKMCYQYYLFENKGPENKDPSDKQPVNVDQFKIDLFRKTEIIGLKFYLIEKNFISQEDVTKTFPDENRPKEFLYLVAEDFPLAIKYFTRDLSVIQHAIKRNPAVAATFDDKEPAEVLNFVNEFVYTINPHYADIRYISDDDILKIVLDGRFVHITRSVSSVMNILNKIAVENDVHDRVISQAKLVERQLTETEIKFSSVGEELAAIKKDRDAWIAKNSASEQRIVELSEKLENITKLLNLR